MLRKAVGLRHIIFHERPNWIYTLYMFEERVVTILWYIARPSQAENSMEEY